MSDTNVTADPRTEYIAGLRMLADLYEANPHLRLPYTGRLGAVSVYITTEEDQPARLAEWARALPGKKTKGTAGQHEEYYKLSTQLRGLEFEVVAYRDEVCRKVVIGTETVTKKVKDPALLEQVPEVEVTEEVEIVEYHCGSILGDRDGEAADEAGELVSA